MAEETPNPNPEQEEEDEEDEQQTLDDLTVLTDGDEVDTAAEEQGALGGGDAEPEDRTLGTIHAGSQTTENELMDNLEPQQAPIIRTPKIAESEIQDRGIQVGDIQTTTTDAGTESQGEASNIGGSRSFGPGGGPTGPGLGGIAAGAAGTGPQTVVAPADAGGDAASDGGAEKVPVEPVPVAETTETVAVETPPVVETAPVTEPVVVPGSVPEPEPEPEPVPVPKPVNVAPDAVDDAVATDEDASVTINVLANDTDLDGDNLNVTSATLPDGVDGTVIVNADGTVSFTPGGGFDALGVGDTQDVVITYTISDGQGGTDTATATVTVTGSNDGPIATADTATTDEDSGVTIDVLANDTDLDGDNLSVTSATLPDGVDGTVVINADGTVSFTPGGGFDALGAGETQDVAITYTISDGQGGTSTSTATVTVTGTNDGPVASNDTALTQETASVTLNVLANDTDLDGDSLSVTDATLAAGVDGAVTVNADGTITFEPGPSFANLLEGESQQVDITYTISDGQGGTDTATATVTVTGSTAGVIATADAVTTGEDSSVTIDVLSNDVDLDGGVLSVVDAVLPTGVDGTVVVNANGTISFTPGGEFDALGVGESQDVVITYTVTNDGGLTTTSTTATVTVTGSNDGPIATADVATTDEDSSVTINVLANDTDADTSDTLTVTDATLPVGVDGEVVVNPDGTISFTPGAEFDALGVGDTQDVVITYTISDGQGGTDTATATVTVTGSNDGPVATADVATTDESTAVTIDVLANDTDIDGNVLSVTGATLPDGIDGTVVVNADGTVTFTPGDSFATMVDGETQDVEITYTIADETGATSTATVTVTVNGQDVTPPPDPIPDPAPDTGPQADIADLSVTSAVGAEDSAVALNINAVLNDLDGGDESLSITISNIPAGAVLSDGTQNADGSWTISSYTDDNGALVSVADQLDGLTMTPPRDFYGDINLSVTATSTEAASGDSISTTQTLGVTVTPEFDNPNLGVADASGAEGTAIPLDVTADMDPGAVETVVDVIVAGVPNGAVLSAGTDNGDGTWTLQATELDGLTITPPLGFSGDMTLTALATSSDGGTSLNWFTVGVDDITNAPVAVDDLATTGEDTGVTIDVLANDTDIDGNVLSVTGATLPDGVDGTVVVNADGTVTFTPGDGFDALGVGDTQDVVITYTISDGEGGTDTATATVTVTGTNDGPVASDEAITATEDGGAVSGQLDATDLDGDALTYTLTGDAVPGLTVNADGSYSFDPGEGYQDLGVGETAEVTFTYEVSDGQGGTSTATGTITVEGTNDGPVASDEALSGTEDTAITFTAQDLLSNDTDVDGDSLTITNIDAPDNGTLVDNGDGSYTFTPDENWSGDTSFTYTVSDGEGGTSTATTTIEVSGVADEPTLNVELGEPTATGGGDSGGVLVSENFDTGVSGWGDDISTVDGQMEVGRDETATKVFDFGSDHAGETVTISFDSDTFGSWDEHGGARDFFIVNANGNEMVNTSDEDSNSYSFEVTLDENGQVQLDINADTTGSDEGVFIDNLEIASGDDWSGGESSLEYPLDITSNLTDMDGSEQLVITIDGSSLPDGAMLSAGVYDETSDTFTLDPTGGDLDGLTITVPADAGEFDISVTATSSEDGTSASVTSTVSVEVNDAPVAQDDSLSGTEDRTIIFSADDLLANDTDSDGDTLTITSFDQPDHGTITDNGDGTYTFTPDEDWSGDTSFDYTVSDGEGGTSTATASVSVEAVADAPDLSIAVGEPTYIDDGDQHSGDEGSGDDSGKGSGKGHGSGSGSGKGSGKGSSKGSGGKGSGKGKGGSGNDDGHDGDGGGELVYPLNITAAVNDASESLVVTFDGVPDGATISEPAVYDEASGTWSVDGSADMSDLTMTVPEDSGDFLLNVNATSTDVNGDTFTTSRVVEIDVDDDGEFDIGTTGTDGNDTMTGTSGDDALVGGEGDDILAGGAGDDTLIGGEGDDTLDGGADDDIMVGGDGDDTFEGGAGDDMAFGDGGNDLFIFGAGDGSDYFDGGDGWTDTISMDGMDGGPGVDAGWTLQVDDDATYTQTETGIDFDGDASGTIQLSDGSELTFEGVDKIEW